MAPQALSRRGADGSPALVAPGYVTPSYFTISAPALQIAAS
jgi:hypothetical protein